jgi:hypothetical protein
VIFRRRQSGKLIWEKREVKNKLHFRRGHQRLLILQMFKNGKDMALDRIFIMKLLIF